MSAAQAKRVERKERKPRRKIDRAPDPNALLYSRKMTARALSCSIMTVIRLEAAGRLRRVRLLPNGQIHHPIADVQAIAEGTR